MKRIIATIALSVAFIHPALGSNHTGTFSAESYDIMLDGAHQEMFSGLEKASVFVHNEKMNLVLNYSIQCQEKNFCPQVMPWPRVIIFNIEKAYRNQSLCAPITYQASTTEGDLRISVSLTVVPQSDDCPAGGEAMLELKTEDRDYQIYTSTLLFEGPNNFNLNKDPKWNVPSDPDLIGLPVIISSI